MQIFFGGKLIGGADDLVSLKSKGKLSDVLAHHEGVEELPQLLMSAVTEAASGQQVSLSPAPGSLLLQDSSAWTVSLASLQAYNRQTLQPTKEGCYRFACMQGASRAIAPAGTPIEEYSELKRLSDSLREDHLRGSAAGSRYVLCLVMA